MWKCDENDEPKEAHMGFLLTQEEMKHGVEGLANPKVIEDFLTRLKENHRRDQVRYIGKTVLS